MRILRLRSGQAWVGKISGDEGRLRRDEGQIDLLLPDYLLIGQFFQTEFGIVVDFRFFPFGVDRVDAMMGLLIDDVMFDNRYFFVPQRERAIRALPFEEFPWRDFMRHQVR